MPLLPGGGTFPVLSQHEVAKVAHQFPTAHSKTAESPRVGFDKRDFHLP